MKYFDGSEINSMRSSLGLTPLSRSISNPACASTDRPAYGYFPPDRPGSVRSVVDNMRIKRETGGNTTSPVSHQVERLKIENEDLNQKLRKTRLALNENTARHPSVILIYTVTNWEKGTFPNYTLYRMFYV